MTERPQLEYRALEPVAQCLIRHLLVPDVYLSVAVGAGVPLDLVLVDRAGTGDVHVVQVTASPKAVPEGLARLLAGPGQYRWLAVHASEREVAGLKRRMRAFYPVAGAGRVGLVRIVRMADDDIGAQLVWKAERFHGASDTPLADSLNGRPPDIHFA